MSFESAYIPSLKGMALSLLLFSLCIALVAFVGGASMPWFSAVLLAVYAVSFAIKNRELKRLIYHLSRDEVYVELKYYNKGYFLGRFVVLLAYVVIPLLLLGLLGIYVGLGIVLGLYSGILLWHFSRELRLRLWMRRTGISIVKKVESYNQEGSLIVKMSYKRAQ
ncbi:hypothetical protein PQ610_05610 [Tardisphaera miroshnichenkoae]